MREKISFCEKQNTQLEEILSLYGVKYRIVGDGRIVPRMISFSIHKDSDVYSKLLTYVHTTPIITIEYSDQELRNAPFLTIMPKKNAIDIVNNNEAFQYSCCKKTLLGEERFYHKEQVKPLMVRRVPREGTTFFASSAGFSEIFVSYDFFELVKNNSVSGVKFIPVVYSNRGNNQRGIFQIVAEHTIPFERICFGKSSKIKRCPVCGKPKIEYQQAYQLSLKCLAAELNEDFYMTEAVFGEGISHPFYMISHHLYTLILNEGMTKDAQFVPVKFSNKS